MASGCVAKCIFDQIEDNLVKIQPNNQQNVQKTHFFLQKAPRVNGLMTALSVKEAAQQSFCPNGE